MTDLLRQRAFRVVACGEHRKAAGGQAGVMIAGEAFHHRAIAALHENIRNGFSDAGAVGNGKQMVMSLGLRNRD